MLVMKPQQTIIIGVLVLLSIIACIALVDSIASLQGPSDNSPASNLTKQTTSGVTAKATTTATAKAATTVATNVTAKGTTAAATNVTAKATAATTTLPVVYTTNQINQHFIDIAFDPNNQKISKVSSSTEKIAITGSYKDKDKAVLSDFIQQFNAHSTTLTLPGTPTEGSEGNIVVKFMTGPALDSLSKDTSYNSVNTQPIFNTDDSGTICSIYRSSGASTAVTDYVYLNSDLADDVRAHYLIRGILYHMGFPGESGRYPTSIFYSQPNTVVKLSPIDLKAVEIMYGTTITNGMTLSTARSLFPTS